MYEVFSLTPPLNKITVRLWTGIRAHFVLDSVTLAFLVVYLGGETNTNSDSLRCWRSAVLGVGEENHTPPATQAITLITE